MAVGEDKSAEVDDGDDGDGAFGHDCEPRSRVVRTPVAERSHGVHHFAGRAHEVLDALTGGFGVSVVTLSPVEAAETVIELSSLAARVQGLMLTALDHAHTVDVGAASGATSTGAWVAQATCVPSAEGRALVRLAHALAGDFAATSTALSAGVVDVEQARVIVDAVKALPSSVSGEDRVLAEKHLQGEADRLDSKKLRVAGKHLLAVIDPDAADEALARRLEAEERAAARQTMLKLWDDGNGTSHGVFKIPSLHRAMLAKAIDAFASPLRPDPIRRDLIDEDGVVTPRHTSEVLGEAFIQFIERFPTKEIPLHGGINATVVVTMDLDTLLGGLKAASLDTGGYLSAGEARRLSCQANLIPAVLGSKSEVLDLGLAVRCFTGKQRLALGTQGGGCAAEGCDRPSGWCHAHHKKPWSAGGPTDLANGALLCPRHHTLIHHSRYTSVDLPNGKIRLTKTPTNPNHHPPRRQ